MVILPHQPERSKFLTVENVGGVGGGHVVALAVVTNVRVEIVFTNDDLGGKLVRVVTLKQARVHLTSSTLQNFHQRKLFLNFVRVKGEFDNECHAPREPTLDSEHSPLI